jgi:hypothetical protein
MASEPSWREQVAAAVEVENAADAEALILDLSDALMAYEYRYDTPEWRAKREAVERLIESGRELRRHMARADAVLGLENCPHPDSDMFWSAWHRIEDPIDKMVANLEVWLRRVDPPFPTKHRKGNPHSGIARLRLEVFGALDSAGITLSQGGLAGEVLAIILGQADRIDKRDPRSRAEFSGKDWKKWRADYVAYKRQVDVWYAAWKASGIPSMKEWAKQYDVTTE